MISLKRPFVLVKGQWWLVLVARGDGARIPPAPPQPISASPALCSSRQVRTGATPPTVIPSNFKRFPFLVTFISTIIANDSSQIFSTSRRIQSIILSKFLCAFHLHDTLYPSLSPIDYLLRYGDSALGGLALAHNTEGFVQCSPPKPYP